MNKKEMSSNLSVQVAVKGKEVEIIPDGLPQEVIEVVSSLSALKEKIGISQSGQNKVCVYEKPYHVVFGIPIDGEYKEFAICRREDIRKGATG